MNEKESLSSLKRHNEIRFNECVCSDCDQDKAFLQGLSQGREEGKRYREALEEIRDQDQIENCLDPQWAARIAALVLIPVALKESAEEKVK